MLEDWWGGGGFNAPEDVEPIVDWQKKQNANERLQVFGDDFLGDAIDPHTGSLVFTHTDIALPGNSALPVALVRSRSNGLTYRDGTNVEFGDWDIKVPRISVMSLSARPWTGQRCSSRSTHILTPYSDRSSYTPATQYSNGITLSVEGVSSAQILDDTGVSLWPTAATKMTKDYWYFTCITASDGGQGFIGHAPNGDKYRFNKFYTVEAPRMGFIGAATKARKVYILAATEVTDVHGNWVRYTYDSSNRLTRIYANDGRDIRLTYSGNLITRASAHGRTWTYQYRQNTYQRRMWMPQAYRTMTGQVLSRVVQPDGQFWEFNLDGMTATAAPAGRDRCQKWQETVSVKHPYGATGTFVLKDTEHRHVYASQVRRTEDCMSGESTPGGGSLGTGAFMPLDDEATTATMAIIEKRVTGANMTPSVWRYTYENDTRSGTSSDDRTNWTKVQTPSHHETYYHSWVSEPLGGKLMRKETRAHASGPILKTETYQYQKEAPLGFAYTLQYPGPGDINTPVHQTSVVIKQDGDTFTTNNIFNTQHSSSLYSFSKPVATSIQSNVSTTLRNIEYSYEHNKPKWILGLQKTRKVNGREIDRSNFNSDGQVTTAFRNGALYANYGYNSDGTVAWAEDANLRRYQASNYRAGAPQRIIRPDNVNVYQTLDMFGGITSLTDANNNQWTYSRDNMGRLTVVNPPGSWTNTVHSYSFNASVGPVHTITHGPRVDTIKYDARFRPVEERVRDTLTNRTTYTKINYDTAGREVFRSFPSFNSNPTTGVTKQYDGLSRLITESENVSPFATTRTSYHSGHRKTVVDAANFATHYYHYGYNGPNYQFVSKIVSPHDTTTDIVRNIFNEVTEVRQQGRHNGIFVDQKRNYYYNSRRQLCRISEPDVDDTVYQYNNWDLLAYQKGLPAGSSCATPSGVGRVSLVRDDVGRIKQRDYADTGTPDVFMSYDGVGNLLSVNRGGANWTYSYNTLHLPTSERLTVDGRQFNLAYQYNLHGHLTNTTLPGGTSVNHTPDGLGRARTAGSFAHSATYHADSQLSQFTFGNNYYFSQTLNSRMLPQRLLSVNRGGVKPLDLNYSYDTRKLVTSIIDGAVSNNNRNMTYDGLERLITASGPWGQGTFSYDSLGNIRSKNLGSRRVTINYDSNLRVKQSIDTGGLGGSTGVRSFDYDTRGNTEIAGALTFTYDYADQPITVSGAEQGVYQYDGNFKRVKNTVGGDTIYNVYTQSGQLAHVHNMSKNERTDYVKLGSLTVARVKNGTPTYLHHDQLGTAVAATNTSASIIWTKRYTPFGIGLDNNSSNDDQAGYTGHIEDDHTGLVYMQARYYDPVIGRFYSNDPKDAYSFLSQGKVAGFNRYAYAANNPYKYKDPDGKDYISVFVSVDIPFVGGVDVGAVSFSQNAITGRGENDFGVFAKFSKPVEGGGGNVDPTGIGGAAVGVETGSNTRETFDGTNASIKAGLGTVTVGVGGLLPSSEDMNVSLEFGPSVGLEGYQEQTFSATFGDVVDAVKEFFSEESDN
ncbi:RHS repeat-associated core domain-containing protein [Glaciecola sp. SC05]|uniref:RHS repeat-associated core domain-containing protein n=1 Tax=Glaciecola sp. SC05 TaxID=1987355 RepID=UPI003529C83D